LPRLSEGRNTLITDKVTFTIDGTEIRARAGQMIIEAADEAGVYIPRLCHKPGLAPFGSCRLCTVLVNGRPASACTQPVAEGVVVENDTPTLRDYRRTLIEMLFVEGNHFCMFCEGLPLGHHRPDPALPVAPA
jgi:[NiFe] hydrogenase diaphorase moiety small subunit